MAKSKIKSTEDLRQLSVDELKSKLVSARKDLFEKKLKRTELKNPVELKFLRKNVARILTLINEKVKAGGTVEKSN